LAMVRHLRATVAGVGVGAQMWPAVDGFVV